MRPPEVRRIRSKAQTLAGLSLLAALLSSPGVAAIELGPEEGLASVEVHGFVSQGFILTLENDYLGDKTTDGSFEFTEVGLNFTTDLSENLRLGVQLFTQDLGPRGDYKVIADWFYLDYRWDNWLGVRAGRLKSPYGLYNESQDIDAARVPVLLPQSVYPLQSREFLFSQTGGELYGFASLRGFGALDYSFFVGTIFLDAESLSPANSPVQFDLRVPYVFGGRLLWETPLAGLRVGASLHRLRLETTATIPGLAVVEVENDSWLWVASAEYAVADLLLSAEYSRWHTKQRSDNPTLSPAIDNVSERTYFMASFRVTPWLQPGAYYSLFFPDVDKREGRAQIQNDLAATLRFDVSANWLIKLEGHYMVGTAGLLDPIRFSAMDTSTAAERWGAFFLKTTAYF
jgi:hypothetical protein